ncbi:MAG: YcaO-like family protein [Jatrophihabitans sp.]
MTRHWTGTALDTLVSADVGPIVSVHDGMTGWPEPRLHKAYAATCDLDALFGQSLLANAGGIGVTARTARSAALGEAIERYSAAFAPPSRLRRCRADELTGAEVPPVEDWRLLGAPSPTGSHDVGAGDELHWVLATNLMTSAATWLPAHRVFLADLDDPARYPLATSTGLACHVDPWQALLTALLEVVERDAVLAGWSTRTPGEAIDWVPQDPSDAEYRGRFRDAVESYHLVRMPGPTSIPAVFAVAFGAAGQAPVAVGAAARLTEGDACRRALTEARQSVEWTMLMRADGVAVPTAAELTQLEDHVRYYLDPARLRAFEFLDLGDPVRRVTGAPGASAAEDGVRQVQSALAEAGLAAYACDVTTPEVRRCGGWVVRAVVPGLYPLHVGAAPFAGHPRLHGAAINPDPHPFP